MFFKKRTINHERVFQIITEDPYISKVYRDIYEEFFKIGSDHQIKDPKVLEIGGGDLSFARDFWNHVIVTEAEEASQDKSVLTNVSAENLPFEDSKFDVIIAKDSLHHFKDPYKALKEIERVLKSNGVFIVSEPYWSPLGRFIYRYVHPEPWDVNVNSLSRTSNDLWDSNQALLFLLTEKFETDYLNEFSNFRIKVLQPTYGISYLLSGGVHSRTAIPSRFLLSLYRYEVRNKFLRNMTGLNILAVFNKI
jgi:SAM-dependent methyltransferase